MGTPPDLPPSIPFAPIRIAPFWTIQPPWEAAAPQGETIVVQPGAGFGTGYHATTQLCLQAIAHLAPPRGGPPWRVLDFGSGSGILSIAAAKLGAEVDAVEIDPEAIANGEENAELNQVGPRICFSGVLGGRLNDGYSLIVANILRPVLLEFSDSLTSRLAPGGQLILSGLVATDVPELSVRYSSRLGGVQPEVYSRGQWRALVFRGR